MTLRTLDLFSGIGGFSHALNSIATTVAYCDIDSYCRKVIQKNIKLNYLDDAEIFEDVTKLTKDQLNHLKPNMITAGFPCTDISAANPNGKGLKGERSGLFKSILKIIDDLDQSINIVFLENSPRIVDKGFTYLKKEMVKRGFVVYYCLLEAKDVGAFHRRKRWYCLCSRIPLNILPQIHLEKHKWQNVYNVPKMLRKDKTNKKECEIRCGMLGNSVVPQVVQYAWNILTKSTKTGLQDVNPLYSPPSQNIVLYDGKTTVHRDYWATPTHSVWYQYRSLTQRGIGILSNQLYYCESNKIAEKDKMKYSHLYIVNPVFVEMLMGYPKGWTRF